MNVKMMDFDEKDYDDGFYTDMRYIFVEYYLFS